MRIQPRTFRPVVALLTAASVCLSPMTPLLEAQTPAPASKPAGATPAQPSATPAKPVSATPAKPAAATAARSRG